MDTEVVFSIAKNKTLAITMQTASNVFTGSLIGDNGRDALQHNNYSQTTASPRSWEPTQTNRGGFERSHANTLIKSIHPVFVLTEIKTR